MLAVVCPPFLCILALLTREEVHAALGSGVFDGVKILGINGQSGGARWLIAAVFLGPVVMALMAYWLGREAERGFNESVGRPTRRRKSSPTRRSRERNLNLPTLSPSLAAGRRLRE